MEARPVEPLIFLMAVGLSSVFSVASSRASLEPPQLIGCVFYERVNVTCRWKHKNATKMNYTLVIWEGMWQEHQPDINLLNCTTTHTKCTVDMEGLTSREVYCVAVTAHMSPHDISSRPRCQSGRREVKLSPVVLKYVTPLRGSPHCLSLEWYYPKPSEFPVSKEDIKLGFLNSQIVFRAPGERHGKVKSVNVTGLWFPVCGFRPNTSYDIRLRHRYQSVASPWSEWSNPAEGRTGEAAPSATPIFWRQVRESSLSGWRLVTLLWKPLPLTSGRILFYNVTCWTETGSGMGDLDGCRHLHLMKTSCSLHLPVDRCSCTLTASNSGGASPEARLWLPEASEQAPTAPGHISVKPLNDSSLDVGWVAATNLSVTGFVVEWFAVPEKFSSLVHWEKVHPSSRNLLITEGLEPMQRYAVSVTALCGQQQMAGERRTQLIYTREGAPSAGPNVTVSKSSSSTVELSWTPVPVDQLRGFLQNYILYVTASRDRSRNLTVALDNLSPGKYRISLGANTGGTSGPAGIEVNEQKDVTVALDNLSPGNYKISVGANTGGGSGPAGTGVNLHIAAEAPTMTYVLSTTLTSLLVVLIVFLTRIKMMNKGMCKAIPDPSNSSLSHWIPKTDLERTRQCVVPNEPEVKFSEVFLLGESEIPDPVWDQSDGDNGCVRTYLCEQPASNLLRNLSQVKTSSIPNLSAHPIIYSDILLTPPHKNLPSPHRSIDQLTISLSVGDTKPLPGGAIELPDLPPMHVCYPSLKKHQGPSSLYNLSDTSHSCFSPQAEVAASKQPVSQNSIYSFLSLERTLTTSPANTFPNSLPSFSDSIFVDPSNYALQCDPLISSDA